MSRLSDLHREWVDCAKCKLCAPRGRTRGHVVFGEGAEDADIVVIAESPGAREDDTGRPFNGASGEVFENLLLELGLRRDQVFLTYVVGCRPTEDMSPQKNRKPAGPEVEACLPRVHAILEAIDPTVVLLLGDVSLKALANPGKSMTQLTASPQILDVVSRGKMTPVVRAGYAAWHPTYALRAYHDSNEEPLQQLYTVVEKAINYVKTHKAVLGIEKKS